MSGETDALFNFLEIAEELLFSFPLPYDLVVKYEIMRQKILQKLNLPHSSAKIWKLQRDANNKQRLKSLRCEESEGASTSQDYISKLESSHEITIKFIYSLQERLISLHKLYSKASSILDTTSPQISLPDSFQDLERIRFKDLSGYSEIETIEYKLLEQLSYKSINKEADFLVIIERIKDKLSYYDHSIIALEQQIDSVKLQNHLKEQDMQSKLQEFAARCELQRSDFDKYKNSFYAERSKEDSKALKLQIQALKQTIDDLFLKEAQQKELHHIELMKLQQQFDAYKLQCSKRDNQKLDEYKFHMKAQEDVLRRVRFITHETFEKFASSQSEWKDEGWRGRFEETTGEYNEMEIEIEFLCYLIGKLASDNDWLIDRLADLGTDKNQTPESYLASPEKQSKYKDLISASSAFKEFEQARDKIWSQFS